MAHLDALARATGVTDSDVWPLVDRYAGARGVRRCRTAIELMGAGAQSPKETWLRLLLIDGGFPPPQTQIPLYENGYAVAFLDLGWPAIKLAVEYDGDQHRTDRAQYVRDIGDPSWSIGRDGSTFESSERTARTLSSSG